MQGTQRGAFTPQERRAAVLALLVAAAIAVAAVMLQQAAGPSLGPWGAEQASVTMPGVLDAQPAA